MTPQPVETPGGLWRSPMRPEELLARPSAPSYPFRHRGRLHWLEARAKEGGRVALMRAPAQGGAPECVTPPGFNLRSGAHEYGGKCFCRFGDDIIFNNLNDGRIYRQPLAGGAPAALSAPLDGAAFADLIALEKFDAVVAVMERGGRDALVALHANARGDAQPQILAEGAGFYACPAASPQQREIAWMEWDDPHMPWDQSRLAAAELHARDGVLQLRRRRALFDRAEHSVCQVGFFDERRLFFIGDGGDDQDGDFWNFYCMRGGAARRITGARAEYGEAHWQFGQRRWRRVGARIIAVESAPDGDRLVAVNPESGRAAPLTGRFAACAHLWSDGKELLFVARHADRDAEIRSLTPAPAPITSGDAITDGKLEYAASSSAPPASRARAITFPTRDGECAHAYFYAPCNSGHRAPRGALPPLLALVHGGPTGRATPEWHPLKQYFASLGYAVLDVNHRGSTGHGRAYRQRLLGNWGELDADDIADGVAHALGEKWADPRLVFIRGGSAGGYAVLRALTRFPELFSGGACYYGIGNLITLAQITHRFEACYTDRLIGARYHAEVAGDPQSPFVLRSPIFQIAQLRCPLILFQGRDDKVVPPAVSREVADALAANGVAHEYIEYENEGHGFRLLSSRVDSLRRETEFFARIIRAAQKA
ncbi:MAG: prolyl oligopeptidase family serine peptidase [Gammaproteobacteria bacterium]|nr:prolyl oligopeptidase family serine peptidase [Gammaproteobacteria bacterium]MDA8024016.1 prolyl oligopeptidase family serine peptidase [Gammaproteobacteria bacterium]